MKRKYPDRTKRERQNNWVKAKRKEIPLEIATERKCCKLLDEADIEHEKYGQNGDPDRMIFVGGSMHVWFEFKREKFGCLTPAQKRRFAVLSARGDLIYIITNAEEGARIAWDAKRSFVTNAGPRRSRARPL